MGAAEEIGSTSETFSCSVRKRVGRADPPVWQGANLNFIEI